MPSMSSMRDYLNNLSQPVTPEANKEKNFRPSDPQEVNLNKLNTGEEIKIRFVEDGDKSNYTFWRAHCFHELSFKGIKGDDSKAGTITTVRVPAYNVSLDKFGNICMIKQPDGTQKPAKYNVPQACEYTNFQDPINMFSKENDLYNHKERKIIDVNGNEVSLYDALKRKVQYLFQGYIVSAPESVKIYEDARLLKHFRIVESVESIIETYMRDPENDRDNPIDLRDGVLFKYRKTMKGSFPDYSISCFGREHCSVSPEALEDFEKYGADFIGDRLPKAPNEEQRAMIKEMLEAFLGNLPYDPKWDILQYQKFVKQPRNNVASEPSWNSPSSVYTEPEYISPVSNTAQATATETVTSTLQEILGGSTAPAPTIEQQVNDSIPYATAPATTPVAQPAVVQDTRHADLSPEETLSFLNSMQ